MSPPQPQDSLPTPHHFTPNGSRSPLAARSAASGHGVRRSVAVEHPIVEFLRRPGSHVGGEVGLGAGQAAQTDELVNAELVRLRVVHAGRHTSLPVVVGARARAAADAVAPVVPVGEAAAGPAIVRRADALHIFDEPAAYAVEVGDFRIPPHPDAVVDHGAEVFDEVSVDVRADLRSGGLRGDFDLGVGGKRRAQSSDQAGRGGGSGAKEVSAVHKRFTCQARN